MTGVACVDVPPGEKRPECGCFNIGMVTGLLLRCHAARRQLELNVTGTTLRRAFALVIHDSAQERGIPCDWKPSDACSQ